MFYLSEALLVSIGVSTDSHRAIINQIGKHFVQTEEFSPDFGRNLHRMYQRRQAGDYMIEPEFTSAVATESLAIATAFCQAGKLYLTEHGF
jgi:uncharacterized protein (UPF0332 family)